MAFIKSKHDIGQRGDTIVEVLIAIAVVGSVLAITYSVMNKNLQTMRDNQERTDASKLAQSQLELLKNIPSSDLPDPSLVPDFCLQQSTGSANILSVNEPEKIGDGSGYDPGCIDNNIFYKSLSRNSLGNYLITVRWSGLSGNEGNIVMVYRP